MKVGGHDTAAGPVRRPRENALGGHIEAAPTTEERGPSGAEAAALAANHGRRLSPGVVLALQRAAGNRAVASALATQRQGHKPELPVEGRVASAAETVVVQRGPDSQQVLADIGEPKTFKGPAVEVQDQLVEKLDPAISAQISELQADVKELEQQHDELFPPPSGKTPNPTKEDLHRQDELRQELNAKKRAYGRLGNVTFLGAIVLADPIGDDLQHIIDNAELIDLPPNPANTAELQGLSHSLEISTYPLVVKAGAQKLVIENTLRTMHEAKQLDYIRKSNLINDDWVVAIEVHYYYNRGASETKFHKDTRGQTLFVNLSFTNTAEMLGPEYIINPASNAIYDQYVRRKLPEVFVDDLDAVRKSLPGQQHIHATVVPVKGVVAFVDEAVHHKTPTPGHRTVSDIPKYLRQVYKDEYDDAERAYHEYKASWVPFWRWSSYLENPAAKANADAWFELMEKLPKGGKAKAQDRDQMKQWLPPYFLSRLDEIVEEGGSADFRSVTYTHVKPGGLNVPVKESGGRALQRTMSQRDLSEYAVKSGERRTFFRTWVRAVPRKDVNT